MKLIRRLVHRYRHAGPDPLTAQILASMRRAPGPALRSEPNPAYSSQSVAGQLDRWRGERGHPQMHGA